MDHSWVRRTGTRLGIAVAAGAVVLSGCTSSAPAGDEHASTPTSSPTASTSTSGVDYTAAQLEAALPGRTTLNGLRIVHACRRLDAKCASDGSGRLTLETVARVGPRHFGQPQQVAVSITRYLQSDEASRAVTVGRGRLKAVTGRYRRPAFFHGHYSRTVAATGEGRTRDATYARWHGYVLDATEDLTTATSSTGWRGQYTFGAVRRGRYVISVAVSRWVASGGTDAVRATNILLARMITSLDPVDPTGVTS
ncbi:MAG: hypothetical protein ACR2FG_02365 [Marmoricola sp.]